MADLDLGFISRLANFIGSDEGIIRLMISLFSGYPLAAVHRKFFHRSSPSIQHLYFIATGLFIAYFNFGGDVVHSIINILVNYVLLLLLRGTLPSVIFAFIFNLVYLCVGYYYVMLDTDYRMTWTTPHCVLTLRLTGLMFDCYDGRQKQEHLSKDQADTALRKLPSLLEIGGHVYFFGGFLVGPQFPMSRYMKFVRGEFCDKVTGGPSVSTGHAMARLGGGITYIVIYQVSSIFLHERFLLTDTFQEMSIHLQCLTILVWGKLLLYRYVGVWLLTEGACSLTGITHNGQDENGNDIWDACANINVRQYEYASSLDQYIRAFNVNTNLWMAKYVFKRCKFLGNKHLSQFITLMYLAIWHGLYTGYFMTFFLEFLMMKFEREFSRLLSELAIVQYIKSIPGSQALLWVLKKIYAQFMLSYALISFCLLSYTQYMAVYGSVLYVAHVICLGWIPLYPILKKYTKPHSTSNGASTTTREKKE